MAIKPIELIIRAKDEASGILGSLQGKLTAVAATIAAYFGVNAFIGAVKGASDLETGMSRVKAATGASTEEMKLLRQAAEDAGANTKYTSTEAAGALETLAKAGLGAKDAIAALPAVLNLAQAGDIELGQASEFLTKAVMGMGLAFSDAGRVADVLALGANATNTSVTGLAEALSYAAPVAHSMGMSLESTVAIIGKFADAGIDASRAGTALNSILSQFSDPASKFRQELGAAGITTGNFEEALHQLAKAGPAGSKAILAVGQEAGPALRALLGQGMGALDDLIVKLKAAEGSAAAFAKLLQDNLGGSLSGLSSAWDTVKTALATPVLPVLKDAVDQLAGAFKSAVADGTIGRFGEAIATSFQAGIKWAREFAAQVNFKQVAADLRALADRAGEAFNQFGEYATNAGNIVKTACGVMSSGISAVLTQIYGMGLVFSEVSLRIVKASLVMNEALQKTTFGFARKKLQEDAEIMREALVGLTGASEEFRKKTEASMQGVAKGALLARDGFTGMGSAATGAAPGITAAAGAVDDMGAKLEATRQKSQQAEKATNDKKAADDAAAIAIRQLRAEYAALVEKGDLQGAAAKIQEVNKALQGTPPAAKDAAKAAEDAAKKTADAFAGLGITSQAALKQAAESARIYYEQIKGDAKSTTVDAANAFKVYAERAIAANDGVATEALKVKAAMQGLEIQTDNAGKSIVKTMGEGQAATARLGDQVKMTAAQIKALEEAQDRLAMKYTLSSNYTERQISLIEKENALVERRNALERERLNIDKEGYSLNTAGQRVNVDVQNQRSVYENAKSQGLSEAQALRISKQFISEGGQKIGGAGAASSKGENWGTELQKAIDKLVLANAAGSTSGKQDVTPSASATITDYEQQLRDATARGDANDVRELKYEIERLKAGQGGSQAVSTTHIVKYQAQNGQTTSFNAATISDAEAASRLLAELSSARSTASR